MGKIEIPCVGCQRNCTIVVEKKEGQVVGITGHTCAWGATYAKKKAEHMHTDGQ